MDDFKKKLILRLAVAFGVVAVIGFLIFYLGSDIEKRSNLIFSTRSAFSQSVSDVNELARLREVAKSIIPMKETLDKALPRRDTLFSLPREYEKMATDSGLEFTFKFGEESKPQQNAPSRIRFEMNIRGDYDKLLAFLQSIEISPHYINFLSLNLIRIEGNRYNITLSGEIFFNE